MTARNSWFRGAEGNTARLPELASDLVRLKVALIVARSSLCNPVRRNKMRTALRLAFVAILISPAPLWAQSGQSKGQGGIIVLDSVPVYTESDSSQVQYTLKRGEAVGSRPDAGELFFRPRYQFEPRNGRIRINFFPREPELSGKIAVGWIDPSAISIFAFQCCDPKGKRCGPTGIPSLGSMKVAWTPCFIEARDLKLRELEKEWSTAKASPQQGAPKTVELGFTEKQVVDALGQPEKILKVGSKTIYVYKDVKVSFTDGRVADLQ